MTAVLNHKQEKSLAYAAGETKTYVLESLPVLKNGLPNHILNVNLDFKIVITPHAANVDTGKDLIADLVESLRMYDNRGNLVVDLKGYEIRDFLMSLTGELTYEDPADTTAGGDQTTLYAYSKIPFDGTKVWWAKSQYDLLQPVTRFDKGNARIEVTWKATAGTDGTIDSTSALRIGFDFVALPMLVQGQDVRYRHYETTDVSNPKINTRGRLAACILNHADRTYSITSITESQHGLYDTADPRSFVKAWNNNVAKNNESKQNPESPDVYPIFCGAKKAGLINGSFTPNGEQFLPQFVTTETTLYFGLVEIHPMLDLLPQMTASYQRVPAIEGASTPMFSRRDRDSLNPLKQRTIDAFGARVIT
jgi:hypothetical protein